MRWQHGVIENCILFVMLFFTCTYFVCALCNIIGEIKCANFTPKALILDGIIRTILNVLIFAMLNEHMLVVLNV